jgi:hypothetical protein
VNVPLSRFSTISTAISLSGISVVVPTRPSRAISSRKTTPKTTEP